LLDGSIIGEGAVQLIGGWASSLLEDLLALLESLPAWVSVLAIQAGEPTYEKED
jgi:hypothetical protein